MTLSALDDFFIRREVRYVTAYDSVGDGFLQRRGIHQAASREVEEDHALLHNREFIGIDESLGVLVLRDMYRDVIALGKKFIEACRLLGVLRDSRQAASMDRKGSYPITSIKPRDSAALATMVLIAPRPTIHPASCPGFQCQPPLLFPFRSDRALYRLRPQVPFSPGNARSVM